VRVTTAFNRMLRLPGAFVRDVAFGSEGVIVTVALRAKRPVCSGCGARGLQIKGAPRQALAPSRLGGVAVRDRVRAAAALLPGLWRPARGGPVGQGGIRLLAGLRGSDGVAGAADGEDADHQAAADRVDVGREHRHARGRRPPRFHAAGRARSDRRGRDLLRSGSSLPDLRREPRHRRCRVGSARPQRRNVAGVLRRAQRRAEGLDPSCLDRHVRRLRESDPRTGGDPARAGVLRPLPRRPVGLPRDRSGPPRRIQPARPLEHPALHLDQRRALQPAEGPHQPDNQAARQTRRGSADEQADVPRVPTAARAALGLPRPTRGSPGAPRSVARVGVPIETQAVRQARPHDPQTQGRRAGRGRLEHQQRVSFILHLLVGLWW
jgi:hypothetical protein